MIKCNFLSNCVLLLHGSIKDESPPITRYYFISSDQGSFIR